MVIGYKVSLFEKIRMMSKREDDIETVFKAMGESQLKDTKLKIMEELNKANVDLLRQRTERDKQSRQRKNNRGSALSKMTSFRMSSQRESGGRSSGSGGRKARPSLESQKEGIEEELPMMSPGSKARSAMSRGRRQSRDFISAKVSHRHS
jgi:hypothetical protein